MMRRSFGFLVWFLVIALAASAQAAPKKKGKGKRGKHKEAAAAPASAAIAETLGDIRWGMSRDEVLKQLSKSLQDRYRPMVQKTRDPLEKDKLRRAYDAEVKRMQDSYVRFDGKSTGWDVSFLRGEFTHRNDESMLVLRDKNSQNFYFFIDGKLWKWYKAFDAEVFPASNFAQFQTTVQRKFGEGKEGSGEITPSEGARRWIEWQDDSTRLRAVDQTQFYGFYSLVFEDRDTVGRLASLRRNKSEAVAKRNSLVDSVTSEYELDDNSDAIDRITGKTRGGRAEAKGAKSSGKGGSPSKEEKPAEKPKPATLDSSDDPLEGLL